MLIVWQVCGLGLAKGDVRCCGPLDPLNLLLSRLNNTATHKKYFPNSRPSGTYTPSTPPTVASPQQLSRPPPPPIPPPHPVHSDICGITPRPSEAAVLLLLLLPPLPAAAAAALKALVAEHVAPLTTPGELARKAHVAPTCAALVPRVAAWHVEGTPKAGASASSAAPGVGSGEETADIAATMDGNNNPPSTATTPTVGAGVGASGRHRGGAAAKASEGS